MIVHIFDCDGVITDTNKLKTIAFEETAKKNIPKEYIPHLLKFHSENGGKSRWEKFEYVKKKFSLDFLDIDQLCQDFAENVEISMYERDLVLNIKKYIDELSKKNEEIYVASAGESKQIKRLLMHHKLNIKEENIFGSPEKKIEIVKKIRRKYEDNQIIFYGDSLHDAECAFVINAKFVFIYGYTFQRFSEIKDKFNVDLSVKDFSNLNLKIINRLLNN